MRVGDKDILLPTMMVGNYPKPRWYMGQSYAELPVGNLVHDSMTYEAFDDCIGAIIHDQVQAGIDVIGDGRVLGGDSPYANILYYFISRIEGFSLHGPALTLPTYSNLFSPTVVGPVRRRGSMLGEHVKAMRRHTDKPIKAQFPGLQVLTMGSINKHYADVKELAFDLADVYNEEFKELVELGVDIIQIDEFTWHYGLSLGSWENEVFNRAVDGVDAQILVHVCWGNYLGTSGYLPDGAMHGDAPDKEGTSYVLSLRDREATTRRAAACFPRANNLDLDILNYEVARKGPSDLAPLQKHKWDKPFVAGVIDVKTVEIETAAEVADRIRACLEVVPAEQLGLSTDCGLINLPRIVAQAKLRAMVEGAKIVRAELGASPDGQRLEQAVPA